MLSDYLALAFRNLRRRRLRSWLTVIGIIIGITAVVSLIALGQGLREVVSSQFGQLGTDTLSVSASGGFGPPGTGVTDPLTKENAEAIDDVTGVEQAIGRLVDSAKLEFNDRIRFTYISSVPDGEKRRALEETLNVEPVAGRMLRDTDSGKVVVGNSFTDKNNGFNEALEPGSRIKIEGERFEVVGVLEKQGSLILDNVVMMQEEEMRDTLDIDSEKYDVITVTVSETADIKVVDENIEEVLRRERDVREGEEDFSVETPEASLQQVNSVLFAVQLFVYIIAGISILVGGIGIMNTMLTSVLERTREIGIMKAIGATQQAIFSLFFIESGFIGSVGGIIGAGVGSGIAIGLAKIGEQALGIELLKAQISPLLIIGSILGSFLLGSLFGIIPAWNASRLNPVDAIKRKD